MMIHNPIPAELLNRKAQTLVLLAGAVPGPICGIYLIRHRASGKAYIGQSINIKGRWAAHRKAQEDTHLARAIRKHGPDSFDWEILVTCSRAELNDLEAYFVDQCGTLSPKGYNLRSGGGQGQEVTEEVRAKMSEAMKASEAHREAIARLHADPEFQAKMSEAVRSSEACREALARLNADPEFQAKRREASRRRSQDPAWLAKNRDHLARLHADPEFQAKNREASRLAQDPAWQTKNREARRARADQRTHVLVHVTTGAVTAGLRWELSERLGLDSGGLAALVNGKQKTAKSWRLTLPEEIPETEHSATECHQDATTAPLGIPSPIPQEEQP